MENVEPLAPKGVIFKILGAILVFLGTLNLLLLWRGGMEVGWSFGGFFIAGIVLIFIGTIRARYGSPHGNVMKEPG